MANLSIKYRSNTFQEIFGQDKIVSEIENRLHNNAVSQVSLFLGSSGTGKTSCAYIMAKSLVCEHLNGISPCNTCPSCDDVNKQYFTRSVRRYNASNLGIDDMRKIEEDANTYDLTFSGRKVFILEEMQELMSNQKALKNGLSFLEKDYMGEVYFILLAMSDFKLPDAIKDRSIIYRFQPLDIMVLAKYLKTICEKKNIIIDEEKANALFTIAENSSGSARSAISKLDKIIYSNSWNEKDLLREIGVVSHVLLIEFFNKMMAGDMSVLSLEYDDIFIKKLREFIVMYFKGIMGFDYNKHQKDIFRGAKKFDPSKVEKVLDILNSIQNYYHVDNLIMDSLIIKAVGLMK